VLVRVQVIKVYEVEIESNDYRDVYDLSSLEIAERGKLIDTTTDHAEPCGEANDPPDHFSETDALWRL
jgi:hypothetical protein